MAQLWIVRRFMSPNRKTRLLAYLLVWFVALMVTAPFAIQFLPFFPLGLFLVFSGPPGGEEIQFMILGWLVYTIHGVALFVTSSRIGYYVLYGILVLMLATNVVGCHKALHDLSGIH
jgi:hypothetical protein